jgi:hypothetical protein
MRKKPYVHQAFASMTRGIGRVQAIDRARGGRLTSVRSSDIPSRFPISPCVPHAADGLHPTSRRARCTGESTIPLSLCIVLIAALRVEPPPNVRRPRRAASRRAAPRAIPCLVLSRARAIAPLVSAHPLASRTHDRHPRLPRSAEATDPGKGETTHPALSASGALLANRGLATLSARRTPQWRLSGASTARARNSTGTDAHDGHDS